MMNRQRLFTILTAFIALAIALSLMAGCGGNDTATTPEQSQKTTPAEPTAPTQGKVLVVVADRDCNETEFNAVNTVLAGAGYDVIVANASGDDSEGSDGGKIPVATTIAQAEAADYEAVVLIGGMGATEYFDNEALQAIAREMDAAGKIVAAICIAPAILANAGLLEDVEATVSSSEKDLLAEEGAIVVDEPVVVDGNIITGWGPDAANEFAQAVKNALVE